MAKKTKELSDEIIAKRQHSANALVRAREEAFPSSSGNGVTTRLARSPIAAMLNVGETTYEYYETMKRVVPIKILEELVTIYSSYPKSRKIIEEALKVAKEKKPKRTDREYLLEWAVDEHPDTLNGTLYDTRKEILESCYSGDLSAVTHANDVWKAMRKIMKHPSRRYAVDPVEGAWLSIACSRLVCLRSENVWSRRVVGDALEWWGDDLGTPLRTRLEYSIFVDDLRIGKVHGLNASLKYRDEHLRMLDLCDSKGIDKSDMRWSLYETMRNQVVSLTHIFGEQERAYHDCVRKDWSLFLAEDDDYRRTREQALLRLDAETHRDPEEVLSRILAVKKVDDARGSQLDYAHSEVIALSRARSYSDAIEYGRDWIAKAKGWGLTYSAEMLRERVNFYETHNR